MSVSLVAPLADGEVARPFDDPSAAAERPARVSRSHFFVGLLLLGLTVVLWVGSSVLTQYLFETVSYTKPIALTTFCTSTAAVFCLPRALHSLRGRPQSDAEGELPALWKVMILSGNWFFCQWSFNESLQYTALATNTLLSSSSVVWSYLFGLMLSQARLTVLGTACVVLAVGGVCVAMAGNVVRTDPNAPTDTLWGELLATSSAVAYGVMSNILSMWVQPRQMNYVWGFVGIYAFFLGGTLMLLGNALGFESFRKPSAEVLGIMLVNGFLGTSLSDYVWAQGLLRTTPLVATVVLNMTIPVTFILDSAILRQHKFSAMFPIGAVLVFTGIVAGSLDGQQEQGGSRGGSGESCEELSAHDMS